MSTYQWRGRVLVAGALCALLTVPAGAVNALGVAGMGATAVGGAMQGMLANGTIKDPFSADDAQPVGFGGLEKRVTENNMTIKVLERQLAGIGNTDIDGQFAGQELSAEMMLSQARGALAQAQEELKAAEEAGDAAGIAAATAAVQAAQQQMASAQASVESIDEAKETAQRQLDDQYASLEKQIENIRQSLTVAAQGVYLALVSLEDGLDTLDRNLDSLDRQIAVMEKQVEIGMAAPLTLENLRYSRTTLTSQRETLVTQQKQAQNQLAMLCGGNADSRLRITSVPQVTSAQLREMDYEDDLEQALGNSYSIWVKQDAMRQASNDYEDNVTSTVDYFEAAKLDLENEKENVTSSFRSLYTDVQEKQRLLQEAEEAYAMEEKNFAVDELQYERGMISQLDYQTAQDDLAAKQDAVDSAEIELFTAYNTYDWARRGYIGSTAGA